MKKLVLFLGILLTFIVYRVWFLPGTISGFDHPFYFPQRIAEFNFFPSAWDGVFGNGLGDNIIKFFWVETYLRMVGFVWGHIFRLSWEFIQRISWFWSFLGLVFLSSWFTIENLHFWQEKKWLQYFITFILFGFNTYILMIVGGGQMNVALAYGLFPVVLTYWMKITIAFFIEKRVFIYSSLVSGILIAILLFFDLRFVYMLTVAFVIWTIFLSAFIWQTITLREIRIFVLFGIFLPFLVVLGIHFFWIFPLLLYHQNPIAQAGQAYNSTQAVTYLSFAKFENSFGLLHPNWPDNMFGKVSFMRPEFLLLPILAFSSLFFLKIEKNKKETVYFLYFAFLGLIGIFLAKGANDPFGSMYIWMFNHIPGFVLFRDSTKWYMFIVISYAILIPFTVVRIYGKFRNHAKKYGFFAANIFFIVICFYLLWIIKPAIFGQISGTLQTHRIPWEYEHLEQTLTFEKQFSRTFWVPRLQTFSLSTLKHPAISAVDFYQVQNSTDVITKLSYSHAETQLQEMGVEYVIVPLDSEHEIFIKNREYNNTLYLKTIEQVKKISWLKQLSGFGLLAVFQVPNPKDHFWISGTNSSHMSYTMISPTQYNISVSHVTKGEILVFTDAYDSYWQAKLMDNGGTIHSTIFHNQFNSFALPKNGSYSLEITYIPQQWVNIGIIITTFSGMGILGALVIVYKKKIKT